VNGPATVRTHNESLRTFPFRRQQLRRNQFALPSRTWRLCCRLCSHIWQFAGRL